MTRPYLKEIWESTPLTLTLQNGKPVLRKLVNRIYLPEHKVLDICVLCINALHKAVYPFVYRPLSFIGFTTLFTLFNSLASKVGL